ncbi:hypothetical protein BC826DRAFT_102191 [Russula brevipes]|nr:hypothetical protein BC826DRAFT_102191 [Russula brevipes]
MQMSLFFFPFYPSLALWTETKRNREDGHRSIPSPVPSTSTTPRSPFRRPPQLIRFRISLVASHQSVTVTSSIITCPFSAYRSQSGSAPVRPLWRKRKFPPPRLALSYRVRRFVELARQQRSDTEISFLRATIASYFAHPPLHSAAVPSSAQHASRHHFLF